MSDQTILVFTRNGRGYAPAKLQQKLAVKFLQFNLDANTLPAKILFYTDGVEQRCRRVWDEESLGNKNKTRANLARVVYLLKKGRVSGWLVRSAHEPTSPHGA